MNSKTRCGHFVTSTIPSEPVETLKDKSAGIDCGRKRCGVQRGRGSVVVALHKRHQQSAQAPHGEMADEEHVAFPVTIAECEAGAFRLCWESMNFIQQVQVWAS